MCIGSTILIQYSGNSRNSRNDSGGGGGDGGVSGRNMLFSIHYSDILSALYYYNYKRDKQNIKYNIRSYQMQVQVTHFSRPKLYSYSVRL